MGEIVCPVCERGKLAKVEDIISEVEGYVFVEKGERCTHCGEEFVPEKEGQKMIQTARRMGIWGQPLKLHRKLTKSAHGVLLRIPADLEKNLHLKGDEEVAIAKVGPKKFVVEVE